MRFTVNGTDYLIEFERQQKDRPTHVQEKAKKREKAEFKVKTSVATTARILQVTGPGKDDRKVFREYTVGHYYRDRFNFESGRKAALAMAMYDAPTKGGGKPLMGEALSKDFRTAVWHAYHDR